MGSANFVQVGGPQGRTQTLVPGASTQTYIFNPSSLKGMLAGGDYVYADRLRFRVTGNLTRTAAVAKVTPNWEVMAKCFGQVRVFSQFLGEVVSRSMNSVPIIANHDQFFDNGFGPATRKRSTQSGSLTTDVRAVEYEFAINLGRRYLTRPTDSCPWLAFFEGGIIELDLLPSTTLANYGWTMTGNWTCELVIDWFPDRQAIIHAPVANRLYKVTTTGPEYKLGSVGSPNGLDGVVSGARMAVLSWLMAGNTVGGTGGTDHDSGFYDAFGASGGINADAGANPGGIKRIDVPFRDQVSIDAVSAWLGSFLGDATPIRFKANNSGSFVDTGETDFSGWPYMMDASLANGAVSTAGVGQSLINLALEFWPLVWPQAQEKITDMQKVDGDLSFTADLVTPPGSAILHLFRTEEICAFTRTKVLDLMERMGMPHRDRGGAYSFVPKYAGAKRADDTSQWGMPLKIVRP